MGTLYNESAAKRQRAMAILANGPDRSINFPFVSIGAMHYSSGHENILTYGCYRNVGRRHFLKFGVMLRTRV
jgi:hypothetical protein